jgi:hypothetical protein
MPTLSEYAKLATDEMVSGIFDNVVTEDELVAALQWEEMQGNSLLYNRENALPTAAGHAVGDTWTDTEPTVTQKSATLGIIGVQSPIDRYALQTRGNVQSQLAVLLSKMAKALAREISRQVVLGNPGSVSTDIEGLNSLLITDSRFLMMDDGTTPSTIAGAETELGLDRFDAMIDLVEGGRPDALIMNKTMRRKLTSLSRVAGSGVVMNDITAFGHQVKGYDGIPILIDDYITNAETYENSGGWGSSTATTIFALHFGQEKGGHSMLHNGPVLTPDFQPLGTKKDKNEDLYRLVVYVAAAVWSSKHVAGLAGIDSSA